MPVKGYNMRCSRCIQGSAGYGACWVGVCRTSRVSCENGFSRWKKWRDTGYYMHRVLYFLRKGIFPCTLFLLHPRRFDVWY